LPTRCTGAEFDASELLLDERLVLEGVVVVLGEELPARHGDLRATATIAICEPRRALMPLVGRTRAAARAY
jgi:hypothetical protein